MQDGEGHQEKPFIVAGQALQHGIEIRGVGIQITGQDVNVIARSHGLFLFVDFGTVQVSQLVLDHLDGFHMINGLDVHGDDLGGLHVEEVNQYTIIQFRSKNVQITDGRHLLADAETVGFLEIQTGRSDEILGGQAAGGKPLPVEAEGRLGIIHVENTVEQFQPLLAVHRFSPDAQSLIVIEHLKLSLFQTNLGTSQAVRFNRDGGILGTHNGVVTLFHLTHQHAGELIPDVVVAILLGIQNQIPLKLSFICLEVGVGILNVNPRLVEVLDTAPAAEDGVLIRILGLLIVDVIKLHCLGIQLIRDPTDTIRVHSQVRDRLLGRLGMLGLGDLRPDLFDLFTLGAGQLNLAPLFSLISHLGQYG